MHAVENGEVLPEQRWVALGSASTRLFAARGVYEASPSYGRRGTS